jgi:hypothetical protein
MVTIKITPEMIQEAKALDKVMTSSFEFRLDKAIAQRNGRPSSAAEKWKAVPLRDVVWGYWYEMSVMETYSGSGQMNYYYNCIVKMAALGIDVDALFRGWNSHREKWKQEFDEDVAESEIEDAMLEEEGNSGLNSEYNFATWIETVIRSLPDPMVARVELDIIRDDLNTNGKLYLLDTLERLKKLRHSWKNTIIEPTKEFYDSMKEIE